MIKYIVYRTTCHVNNKIYIGIHKMLGVDDYLGSGTALSKAIKKYGKQNFSREILYEYDTLDEAREMEIFLVDSEFIKLPTNYNIALGGGFGYCGWFHVNSPDKLSEILQRRKDKEIKNGYYQGWSDESRELRISTYMAKYAYSHPMKNDQVKETRRTSHFEKYGVYETFAKDSPFWESIVKTRLEKYGVAHHMKSDVCITNMKTTCISKYGVDSFSKTNEFSEKVKNTSMMNWGTANPTQSDEVKQKIKATHVEKYGHHYSKTKKSRDHHSKQIKGRIWVKNLNTGEYKQIHKEDFVTFGNSWVKSKSPMNETVNVCQYCNKTITGPNYKRWHGDNCKLKPTR